MLTDVSASCSFLQTALNTVSSRVIRTRMSETLEKILEEVKSLTTDEKRQLAAILSGANGAAPGSPAERTFESRLAAEGWLSLPQPKTAGDPPTPPAPPFITRGRPCSQILIEERR